MNMSRDRIDCWKAILELNNESKCYRNIMKRTAVGENLLELHMNQENQEISRLAVTPAKRVKPRVRLTPTSQ
jgi:hypothetical protein